MLVLLNFAILHRIQIFHAAKIFRFTVKNIHVLCIYFEQTLKIFSVLDVCSRRQVCIVPWCGVFLLFVCLFVLFLSPSTLNLASQCLKNDFCQQLRAHGLMNKILMLLKDALDYPVSLCFSIRTYSLEKAMRSSNRNRTNLSIAFSSQKLFTHA